MTNHNSPDCLNAASDLPSPRMLLHQEGQTWEQVPSLQESDPDGSQSAAFRSIVVPLDGSEHAEHALPYALAVARRSGAVVRIFHVHTRLDHFEPWQMHSSIESNELRKRTKQDYLREVADRIARLYAVNLETTLIESGDTEDSLVKATAGADLVVMTSRRRGLLRRLWSYSVADALRPRLRVPVLFVRGYPTAVDLNRDPIARHILIPLDGSTLAERILRPATALGRLEKAKLTLVNVQNREWSSGSFEHTNPPGYLTGIASDVKKSVPAVIAQIVTTDRTLTTALISFAEERKIDLIAIATRSDGGMTRLMRGSVSDQLLRRTDLPILLLGIDIERKRAEVTTVVEYCPSSDVGPSDERLRQD